MSGTFSGYLEAAILNHIFTGNLYMPPAQIWVATFITAPDYTGAGGVEVSDTSYQRQTSPYTGAVGLPPYTQNVNAMQFPAATISYSITSIGLYDLQTAGNFLGGAMLFDPTSGSPVPKPITPGDIFRVPISGIAISFWQSPTPSTGSFRARLMVRPVVAEVVR
jgi:hypothetical protein